jgi:hypothetical protein
MTTRDIPIILLLAAAHLAAVAAVLSWVPRDLKPPPAWAAGDVAVMGCPCPCRQEDSR